MSKTVILVGYKKRSGKDVFAKYLQDAFINEKYNTKIFHFADIMKDIVADMFDINIDILNYYKNNNTPILANDIELTDFRKILQVFGSGKMKYYFGKYVWAELVKKKIENSECDIAIIPDFRFEEEYVVFNSAYTIKVNRDSNIIDTHISEVALDNFNFDFVVDNNDTLNSLNTKAKYISKIILDNK